jgi:hypothetical protein
MRALIAIVVISGLGAGLTAQGALAQLGLTEAAARTFVLDEIKSPAPSRGASIVTAGTRAFLKLPPAARGPAATALFAWAKSYANSPAFAATYASYRKGRTPTGREYALSVEAEVQKDIDEQLAGIEQIQQAAEKMPAKERETILEKLKQGRAMLTSPEFIKQRQEQVAAERARDSGRGSEIAADVEETTPADPRKLFARRLREFLNATADVNFSARTISLTGGPDGIEFIDKADRAKPWMWQAAAIVGREATGAAREAAQAWLKELER